MDLRAIPTKFNNLMFRSRLEARWAVFFTELGIEYRYEMEGYDLKGTWYLPDFYLPKQELIVEIKPGSRDDWPDHPVFDYIKETLPECEGLHPLIKPFRQKGGFVVLVGSPGFDDLDSLSWQDFHYNGIVYCDDQYRWCECPKCGYIGIEFNGRADRLACGHGDKEKDKGYNFDSYRLLKAYRMAMNADF